MSKLPAISGQTCVAVLKRLGFEVKRQHGSHIILSRADPFCQVVVPDHRVLDRGTLRAILRQAAIGIDHFNRLL